eukprot:2210062-Amphidinium_carterae.1
MAVGPCQPVLGQVLASCAPQEHFASSSVIDLNIITFVNPRTCNPVRALTRKEDDGSCARQSPEHLTGFSSYWSLHVRNVRAASSSPRFLKMTPMSLYVRIPLFFVSRCVAESAPGSPRCIACLALRLSAFLTQGGASSRSLPCPCAVVLVCMNRCVGLLDVVLERPWVWNCASRCLVSLFSVVAELFHTLSRRGHWK